MATSLLVLGLASLVSAQNETVFSHVQPLNTTILTQYGSSPPVYPSPNTTGGPGWEDALVKAKAFVAELTLEEKADMVTGQPGPCVGNIVAIPRLNFTGLCLQDGPLAIRVADYASVFQAGVSAAATWDKDILYERGYAMSQEFREKGAHVALLPVAGPLGRSGYGGRNWEGFAADPYFTGWAMEQTILGMQKGGVQTSAKHFIANEQETQRNPTFVEDGDPTEVVFESVSSNLDDRTLHELYLWPFANAVRAKAASVMCSYERINGSYACQNSKVLNGVLKSELGFQGYVMSDWGGTHSGVAAVEAGLDMNMPGGLGMYGLDAKAGSYFGGNITAMVQNGTVSESRLDDMVTRIMLPYYWLGQDQDDFPSVDESGADLNTFTPRSDWLRNYTFTGTKNRDVRGDHADLIRKHGSASAVLLKNENNALPLKAPKNIAVFGNDAGEPTQGQLNQVNYEYGTLYSGGGSGTGRFTRLVTPLDAIIDRSKQDNALVQYWLNNTLIVNSNVTDLWIPQQPDVCLVFLKTWAEEAADRLHLSVDWDGDAVVEQVAKDCNNTIVVTHSSGINTLPWAEHPNVTAIMAFHFPGEQLGNSLIDVIYGDVNPSGHLPYTIAYEGADYNAPPTTAIQTTGKDDWQAWFDEKLEIDYRYFDAQNIDVLYEFGFGLSYTTFAISDLKTEAVQDDLTAEPANETIEPGGDPSLWDCVYTVNATISNTGDYDGNAVAQLYVGFPDSTPAGTPPRQLRGFEKVFLAKNESAIVTFDLMRRDLSYWDIISQQWMIPTGDFQLYLGWSSRDLPLNGTITPVSA